MSTAAPKTGRTQTPEAEPDTQNGRAEGELRTDVPLEIAQLIAAYRIQGRKLPPSRARRLLREQAATAPNPYRSLRDGVLQADRDTPRILATKGNRPAQAAHRAIREATR
ncbi:MAG: hypothetical protein L0H81_08605 [Actinomyces sp.]|nr:hypothetical protein [Actinomyces sp.]